MGRSEVTTRMAAIQQEVARRQSSPLTGKPSARPAGKPGVFCRQGEFATIPFPPLASRSHKNTEAPQYAFSEAWRNLSGPMEFQKTKPNPEPKPNRLPPVRLSPGKGTRREDHAHFSSSADEFRPAIPRSGWSPPEPVSASPARVE